jgi:hypothetical protein
MPYKDLLFCVLPSNFKHILLPLSQGPLLSIVVSQAPATLRGTAFGIFYTVMALTTMAGNSVYGTVSGTHAPACFDRNRGCGCDCDCML